MPVEKAVLRQLVEETAGGDQEVIDLLMKKYEANDALAMKFVGTRMTQADYTRKTQELAEQRRQFESQAGSMETLRKQLETAQVEKEEILRDLAKKRVTVARASELMNILQEKYNLDDNDLPGMSDLIETRKAGTVVDSTPDIDAKLASFGDDLMKRMEQKFVTSLTPELGAMASLPLVWHEIDREHVELTGKPLSFKEKQDILAAARAGTDSSLGKGSIMGIWQDRYQIEGPEGLRMKKRDEGLRKTWEQEREATEAKKRQDEALNIVTPQQRDLGAGPGISAAFKTQFKQYPQDPNSAEAAKGIPSLEVQPGQHVRQTGDRGPSGAQRAARKYLTNQNTGKVA